MDTRIKLDISFILFRSYFIYREFIIFYLFMIIHRLNENLIIILIFYSFLFILILFIDYVKNIFLKISSLILLILSNTFSLFHSLFTIINHKNFAYLHLYSHFSVPSSTSIVKDKEISGFDNVVAKGKQNSLFTK